MLDVKMPRVSGLEVLRQIKGAPDLARIPVVVVSSSYEDVDLKEANQLGASAYVVKPVRFQDFVDAVKTIGAFWGVLNILPTEQHKYRARR
jgi:CheY-like chemotaxis protein